MAGVSVGWLVEDTSAVNAVGGRRVRVHLRRNVISKLDINFIHILFRVFTSGYILSTKTVSTV